jgi:hypothetical protein
MRLSARQASPNAQTVSTKHGLSWIHRYTRTFDAKPDGIAMRVHEMASVARPEVMYILKSRTKNFGTIKLTGSLVIQTGQWSRITEISVTPK